MPMREARVIALAGVFQACRHGSRARHQRPRPKRASAEASLASIFRIDADSTADVFGGISGVRLGLEQIDRAARRRYARSCLHAARAQRAAHRAPARPRNRRAHATARGIEAIEPSGARLGFADPEVQTRLAALYCDTLSHLRPRVIVHGNPAHLGNPRDVEQIRAMLLAAVRAAVLWRQVGGGQFRLLLRRREYAMLARGLLARCTLIGVSFGLRACSYRRGASNGSLILVLPANSGRDLTFLSLCSYEQPTHVPVRVRPWRTGSADCDVPGERDPALRPFGALAVRAAPAAQCLCKRK